MYDQFRAYIALFYAIDRLYEFDTSDTIALCASELNPFLFRALGSADPAHYVEFSAEYARRFGEGEATPDECFSFAQEYAAYLSDMFHEMYPDDATILDLFTKHIDYGTWLELFEIASEAAEEWLQELADA